MESCRIISGDEDQFLEAWEARKKETYTSELGLSAYKTISKINDIWHKIGLLAPIDSALNQVLEIFVSLAMESFYSVK